MELFHVRLQLIEQLLLLAFRAIAFCDPKRVEIVHQGVDSLRSEWAYYLRVKSRPEK